MALRQVFSRREASPPKQRHTIFVLLIVAVGLCIASLSFCQLLLLHNGTAPRIITLDDRPKALMEDGSILVHRIAPVGSSGSAGDRKGEISSVDKRDYVPATRSRFEPKALQLEKITPGTNARKENDRDDYKNSLTERRPEHNGQSNMMSIVETQVDGVRRPVKPHNETGESSPIAASSLLESPRQHAAKLPANASSNSNAVLVDSTHSLHKNNQTKSEFQSATASRKKRLEFLHIPKTGGSSIEAAAAKQGVSWGLCLFIGSKASIENSNGEVTCLDTRNTRRRWGDLVKITKGCVYWHYPSHRFPSLGRRNPYRDASLFAVVRNPYDRVISEYYYRGKYVQSLPDDQLHDPKEMNKWIQARLKQHMKVAKPWGEGYCFPQGHFIPQHQFVYDGQRKAVDHVLHLENLNNEFDDLMAQYGLNISLPTKRTFGADEKLLGVQNLTAETIGYINLVYAEDFSAFGYNKTQVSTKTKQ